MEQFLDEEALTKGAEARASRCGAIRTRAVERLTILYLLRVRFLIEQPGRTSQLAEEVQVVGHESVAERPSWLADAELLALLEKAQADANISDAERKDLITAALTGWKSVDSAIQKRIEDRAESLLESHRSIRQAVSARVRGLAVKPQLPPDLLGVLVLQPLVGSA